MSGELHSSGGPGGIGANTDDMRATAHALHRTNGELGRIAGHARGAAFSGALLRTTIFSPGSAAHAEAQLVQAAAVITGLTLNVEGAILVLRTRATLFDVADAGKKAFGVVVSTALWLPSLEIVALARMGFPPAVRTLNAFPQLTDVASAGLVHWLASGGGRRPPLPTDYAEVLALLQAGASMSGWSGPVKVADPAKVPTRVRDLADLVGSGNALEQQVGKDPHGSAVRIIKVDHPSGSPSWIVVIPGTDFGGKQDDPSNAAANFGLMRGEGPLLQAVRDAMAKAHIQPGERVMVNGHSQGGIAAMALACNPGRYSITNVVTTGAPVSQFHPPPHVQVLSIEHAQDPVPRLDGEPNPQLSNWTTITRDVADDASVQQNSFNAHGGHGNPDLYTQTASLVDKSGLAALPDAFRSSPGMQTTQLDYALSGS